MSEITEKYLKGINTYGYKYEIDEYGYMFIELPHVMIMVNEESGRYGFDVTLKEGFEHKMTIDFVDFFPRYFLKLQRAFDEMNDYIIFNQKELGLINKKIKI